MRVDDVPGLVQNLRNHRPDWDQPDVRAELIDAAMPRILGVLELLPEATADSRLLELGSAPFFTSLCLERVWPGRLTLANYSGSGTKGSQRLLDAAGQPAKVLEYDLFNIEMDEFPYPDGTFEVVIFSELIEHLALNPVWALSEIHRVLKKDGHVIITTPNSLSLERLDALLYGRSEMVDKYAPLHGYGARHNREYHAHELHALLESTGFTVETLVVRDLVHYPLAARLSRALKKNVLRLWSAHPHQSHILLRARRNDVFRWNFPDFLYDHMQLYVLVRHPWLEIGVNDTIQCGPGWLPREDTGEGVIRRVVGTYVHDHWMDGAVAFLRGKAGARRAVLLVRGSGPGTSAGRVLVRRRGTSERLASESFDLQDRSWKELAVALARPTAPDEELEVEIEVAAGQEVAVRRMSLEP